MRINLQYLVTKIMRIMFVCLKWESLKDLVRLFFLLLKVAFKAMVISASCSKLCR